MKEVEKRICSKEYLPDLEIDRIEYPELQKGVNPDMDAKSVRLDVYIRDGKDTVYDIEIAPVLKVHGIIQREIRIRKLEKAVTFLFARYKSDRKRHIFM